MLELNGGQVHGNADVCWPGLCFKASCTKYPLTDCHNHTSFLRKRNEIGWRDEAADRMMPSEQCFELSDSAGIKLDQWLVVDLELVVGQRTPKIQFQQPTLFDSGIHLR